ncbi:CfaE/CblD family pilus tip adhesin [Burkholderia diffusa]|uniref:CfaE/CblD family pilus tip adhesin n=1 Tax=Burkholderia diffusa TaxID=488732 RepID=UPI0018C7591E|nr:CfaE/CblD family pilus tip adhesin [Burkholderia diffusa]
MQIMNICFTIFRALDRLRFYLCIVVVATAVALCNGGAFAAWIEPSDKHEIVDVEFDRSSPPVDKYIWNKEVGAGGRTIHRQDTWVCLSETDPATGACATKPTTQDIFGNTTIPLLFTERRSKMTAILTVYAHRTPWMYYGWVCGDGWAPENTALNSKRWDYYCGGSTSYGVGITAWLPSSELAKIPSGGIWKADLKLRFLSVDWKVLANHSASITLTVTDRNNIEVYLPAFGSATPLVNLNLRSQPIPGQAGGRIDGRATLDVCLYDGHNANSDAYQVTLSDTVQTSGRAPELFSVVRDGGNASNSRDRVDYAVALTYNGERLSMRNGETVRLQGVNRAEVRQVRLPNIQTPVLCTPTPLELTTPAFNQIDKVSGHYTGTLRLVFTTPSSSL